MFEFVNLDPDVVHDAQAADAFDNLLLFQRMRRARHEVNFNATFPSTNETLNDDGVLVTLVLDEQRVPRLINKLGDAFAPIGRAPDQMRAQAGLELLTVPVGV